ncbi:hypothetical protein KY290_001033 [Solanum tuberosum]|uniref:Uncharacterized protein n=1 Tax=Solanum tuberosum TaxID=4113 RepID=A0ABQ7WL37_SOLTU|nr:hypothetical protein KY290_001033 [Solanum tuberosum]
MQYLAGKVPFANALEETNHQQKVESLESITVTEKEEEEIGESEITKDSEVTDSIMEVQTECSPLEPPCAESEANSHASSEVPLDLEQTTADVFDPVYSLMKEFPCLTPGCKLNLVDSLRSNLSVLLPTVDSLWRVSQQKDGNADEEKNDSEEDECSLADRVASYRNAFQIYTFFRSHCAH